jgi:hypothetical protein
MSAATTRPAEPGASRQFPLFDWRERTRRTVGAPWPGPSCLVTPVLSAPCGRKGQLRRNAVGAVGVKLVAAPDAPLRGEVLVRTPADLPYGIGRCTASTDIHVLRGSHVSPALGKGLVACEPRAGRSDKHPHALVRGTQVRRAGQDGGAWRAANAADDTRQRASVGRTCGRARTPGRTPSERNHRSVLRLHWRA